MRGGHAPPWGVETPNQVKVRRTLFGVLEDSLRLCVGEPVTNVQAPKAKGHRNRTWFGFPTPRPGVFKGSLRGRTANISPLTRSRRFN